MYLKYTIFSQIIIITHMINTMLIFNLKDRYEITMSQINCVTTLRLHKMT